MRSRRANGEGSIFTYRNGFAAYVLAPLTYATYESHVKNYIEPGIGAMRFDRLRVADVQAWLNRLATQCQCCAQGKDARRALRGTARCCAVGLCCHRVASPRTVKDIRTVLRSGLNSAVRQELLDRNVAQLVQILKQRKRKLVAWTSEEARRFSNPRAATLGTPIDSRTLNRKFTAPCDAAGVRRLTVHDARHTCATLLVDLDVHPRVIMRILRHAHQAVTMEIYANASSAATRDALRRLGDILH